MNMNMNELELDTAASIILNPEQIKEIIRSYLFELGVTSGSFKVNINSSNLHAPYLSSISVQIVQIHGKTFNQIIDSGCAPC